MTNSKHQGKGESIETFLRTHPYKRQDSLRHICQELGLSTDGTVPMLQARILNETQGNDDHEVTIRKVAQEFQDRQKTLVQWIHVQ